MNLRNTLHVLINQVQMEIFQYVEKHALFLTSVCQIIYQLTDHLLIILQEFKYIKQRDQGYQLKTVYADATPYLAKDTEKPLAKYGSRLIFMW